MPAHEQLTRRLTGRLAALGAAGVAAGAALAAAGPSPAARAFGRQTAAWGAIDLAIAGVSALRPPGEPGRIRRVLLVNAALDVLYVAAGAHVAVRTPDLGGRLSREEARGHGTAIALQGLALLALDTRYARAFRPHT